MKKILIFLLSIYLYSSLSVFADDISDFQIEGISIGDSLLDYLTVEEILNEIEMNKDHYKYLKEPNKYAEIYMFKNLSTYDSISFMIKNPRQNQYISKKDKKYIILGIRGLIKFNNDYDSCLKKRDEISEILSSMFPDSQKEEQVVQHGLDPSGNSFLNINSFTINSGASVGANCTDWEETFRIKNNYAEGLNVEIFSGEVDRWLRDH